MNLDEIDPNKEYRLREIVRAGWIKSIYGTQSYDHVLNLVKAGKLKARDASNVSYKPFYLVKGQSVLDYLKAINEDSTSSKQNDTQQNLHS